MIWKSEKKIRFHERKVEESENSCLVCANFIEILKGKKVQSNEKKVVKIAAKRELPRNEVTMWINLPLCSLFACNLRFVHNTEYFLQSNERLQLRRNFMHQFEKSLTRVAMLKMKELLELHTINVCHRCRLWVVLCCLKRPSDNRFGKRSSERLKEYKNLL